MKAAGRSRSGDPTHQLVGFSLSEVTANNLTLDTATIITTAPDDSHGP